MYTLGMNETMTATQVRANFLPLVDEVAEFGRTITVTKNGIAKAVVIAKDELEGLFETIALMSNRKATARIRKGLAEIENSAPRITLNELKKRYNEE